MENTVVRLEMGRANSLISLEYQHVSVDQTLEYEGLCPVPSCYTNNHG